MKASRLLLAVLCLLASATASADLRVFDVAAAYREALFNAISDVLDGQQYNYNVELLPTGQLLVDAPPDMLDQVAAVIEAVTRRPIAAAERVELRYWILFGAASPNNQQALPDALRPVRQQLEKLHGNLGIQVLASASLVTESGKSSGLNGSELSIAQRTWAQGDALSAKLSLSFNYPPSLDDRAELTLNSDSPAGLADRLAYSIKQQISLDANLKRGEFLVLAENAVHNGDVDGYVFYVVHWPE